MGDLKLFRIEDGTAVELLGTAVALEKPLQALIERNMEALFGGRLVASEHSTGKKRPSTALQWLSTHLQPVPLLHRRVVRIDLALVCLA